MDNIRQRIGNNALGAVFFTIFLDVLGIGILIPIVPQLLANPHSPYYLLPPGWDYKDGLILLGWLTAIFPILQFFATPILGQLSDRYGRKKVLAISLAGTAIGYVLFAVGILTRNIPLLIFSRALDGITGGNLSVAQAVIADVTPPKQRTRNFGLIGMFFGVGFVLGPYIGSKLGTAHAAIFGLFHTPNWFNPTVPFWFATILSIVNVGLILLLLPETHKNINPQLKVRAGTAVQNIVKAATHPGLRVVFPSVFLYWAGFTFFTTFFQVLLIGKLHFNQSNVGDFYAYIGLWIAIAQGIITPLIAKKYKNYSVLRISMLATGIALFGTLWAHNTIELLLVTPFFAIFNGQTLANSTSLVSASAGPEIQGEVLGINASVQAIAQAIPAVIAGYVAVVGVSTSVLVGAWLMIAAGVLFWVLYHPSRHLLHNHPVITTTVGH